MSRRDWQETFSRDAEHVSRLVTALVGEEVAFDITPRPDGWWRIRADLSHQSLDPQPLEVLAQTTRTATARIVRAAKAMTRLPPLVLILVACTATPRSAQPSAHPDAARSGAPWSHLPAAPHSHRPAVANVATGEGTPVPTTPMPAAIRYTGTATWFCSDGRHGSPRSACTRGYGPSDLVAAIDRKDTTFARGDRVTVRYGRKHVTVTIVDTCACADRRVIDLSIGAFERLAPWGMGVLPVTVELARPIALPETDR